LGVRWESPIPSRGTDLYRKGLVVFGGGRWMFMVREPELETGEPVTCSLM
jgi:hypothetical protein